MNKTLVHSSKFGAVILGLFMTVLIVFFVISLCDTDKTVSAKENRNLAKAPVFSVSALFDGSYISKVETYYSDTFPLRDFFLDVNNGIKKFTSQFSAGNDVVIVNSNKTGDDFAGQSLHDVQKNK